MVVSVRMASATVSTPAAIEQALALLGPEDRPANPRLKDGYLDLLGEADPTGAHRGQRAALNRMMPYIYAGLVHPVIARLVAGVKAPGRHKERRMALEMLGLVGGECVLDVGCGPGATTRLFADAVGEDGLVVGLDASPPMLAAAARRTRNRNLAYIRADGAVLPFRSSSYDAVSSFGALHLFEQPMRAVDEIVRVAKPGARIGILATCELESKEAKGRTPRRAGGMFMFRRDQITGALRDHGLLDIEQRVMRMAQFVSARKPA
jgi:ubiquinone/menaquinone biosynthesis C-methylase UbiE